MKKYLRELSVVVVGIAITFFVSSEISNYKDKQTVNRHLAAIKTELVKNQELINEKIIFYQKMYEVGDYLRKNKLENQHPDSIYQISLLKDGRSVIHQTFILAFETTAFETLKNSGLIGLIDDELSYSLTKTYRRLEGMQLSSDEHMNHKGNLLLTTLMENEMFFDEAYDLTDPRLRKLYYFYAIPNNYHDQLAGQCTRYIQETLLLLDS